jgi:ABC-type branched-subunit amino acid transport system ATPase component
MTTDTTLATGGEPILRLQGVSKRFRGLLAVNAVDLAVPQHSICSLIGPNGAGKSTIFSLITGYLPLSGGEIRYRGRRIDGMPTTRISQSGIARAFQIARPFRELTVYENVRVGALFGKTGPRDVRAVTERMLALTGLEALARLQALSLTVGDLRKLELARALATRPELLLADEPCAGLNPTESEAIIDILYKVREQGVTVLLVEHDMTTVMRVSDTVFVLDAGEKIAEGPPQQVAQDERVIAAYLGQPV